MRAASRHLSWPATALPATIPTRYVVAANDVQQARPAPRQRPMTEPAAVARDRAEYRRACRSMWFWLAVALLPGAGFAWGVWRLPTGPAIVSGVLSFLFVVIAGGIAYEEYLNGCGADPEVGCDRG